VRRSVETAKTFSDGWIHVEKLRDLLEDIKPTRHIQSGEDFIYREGAVKVNKLHFSYGRMKVFKDFSVQIQ
jgi:hypothetical protein